MLYGAVGAERVNRKFRILCISLFTYQLRCYVTFTSTLSVSKIRLGISIFSQVRNFKDKSLSNGRHFETFFYYTARIKFSAKLCSVTVCIAVTLLVRKSNIYSPHRKGAVDFFVVTFTNIDGF